MNLVSMYEYYGILATLNIKKNLNIGCSKLSFLNNIIHALMKDHYLLKKYLKYIKLKRK